MKKYLLLIPAIALIGAGCQTISTSETNSNTNTTNTVVNENVNVSANTNSVSDIDTSDWKTYTNNEYGFSFKYPEDWNLKEVVEGGLGTHPGDLIINNDECNIQITVPHEQFDQEKMATEFNNARANKKYFGNNAELMVVNEIDVLKYETTVNTYGEIGYVYQFMINGNVFSYTLNSGNVNIDCKLNSEKVITTLQKHS